MELESVALFKIIVVIFFALIWLYLRVFVGLTDGGTKMLHIYKMSCFPPLFTLLYLNNFTRQKKAGMPKIGVRSKFT